MLWTWLAFSLGLIHIPITALELSIVDSLPLPPNTGLTARWRATSDDPTQFTLEVWADGGNIDQFFDTVNRDDGDMNGSATSPPLTTTGLHWLAAISSDGGTVVQMGFQVGDDSDDTALSVVTLPLSTPQVVPFSPPGSTSTSHQGTTAAAVQHPASSTTTESTIKTAWSSLSGKTSQTGFHQSLSMTSFITLTTGSSMQPSSSPSPSHRAGDSTTASAESNTSNRSTKSPIIIASIVGTLVLILIIIGCLLIVRRRRQKLDLAESAAAPTPYDPEISERRRSTEPGVSGLPKHDFSVDTSQTERQRMLQNRAQDIERQISESETALTIIPHDSDDFRTENIQLRNAVRMLSSLLSSESGTLSLSNHPPPSYHAASEANNVEA
ncbi:hypothetical protein C8J56DRAFT_1067293 [Mycena floridula]|nr:hypothetical protein C8J56DRAFT_1067293 [Mycena floridula]